jgi:hypothetical protein
LQEGESLLAAAVAHAPALGELSTQGLRRAFIARRGELINDRRRWTLSVERQPHDELLDRLSWSWAWVKLPWMASSLQVKW